MPELLLFAHDHSTRSLPTPSTAQLAALPKLYDLITWQLEGWNWGIDELSHPWFRVVEWPYADHDELDVLLSRLPAILDADMNPTTHEQYRGFHLDVMHPSFTSACHSWFADDCRSAPRFTVPAGITVSSVTVARTSVAVSP